MPDMQRLTPGFTQLYSIKHKQRINTVIEPTVERIQIFFCVDVKLLQTRVPTIGRDTISGET